MVRGSTVVAGAAGCLALVLLVLYGGGGAGGAGEPLPPAPRLAPAPLPVRTAPPPSPVVANTTHAPATNVTHAPSVQLAGSLVVAGHASPHPELCPALGRRLRLVMVVMSAPAHAEARAGIRLTWGHYAARTDVALAFLVGLTSDARVAAALQAEDAVYGDVVRGHFVDSYSNLTLKTLSMLEWVSAYCPRARHVLKTDDDMFINVPRLLAFAERHANESRTVFGKVVKKWGPVRSVKSKYYVSRAQYAPKVLPNFATGPAYLLTADCIRPLYDRALLTPFLRLEDVFLTGVVAQKLGLRRVHVPEFYNKELPPHPCTVRKAISLHMVRYAQQFDLWRKLLDGKADCTSKGKSKT